MTEKIPGGVWPPISQNKSEEAETQEAKREKIITTLRAFFDENGFKDSRGVPVKLEDIYWPTEKEEKAYETISSFIKSDEFRSFAKKNVLDISYDDLKEFLMNTAGFLNEATTFDSIKKRGDHSIRRQIEGALSKAAAEDSEKFSEAYSAYYKNRLSLKQIRHTFQIFELLQSEGIQFEKETIDLYEQNLSLVEETIDKEDGHNAKKYEILKDAQKLEATHTISKFIISFFGDLEKMNKRTEEKVA